MASKPSGVKVSRAGTKKTAAKKAPAKKAPRLKQATLPVVMRSPEVEALLGVSHVTILNLVRAGKLKRIGKGAQVKGGGYLYDAESVRALAGSYRPQTAHKPAAKAPRKSPRKGRGAAVTPRKGAKVSPRA